MITRRIANAVGGISTSCLHWHEVDCRRGQARYRPIKKAKLQNVVNEGTTFLASTGLDFLSIIRLHPLCVTPKICRL
jgi:hypothetical protein